MEKTTNSHTEFRHNHLGGAVYLGIEGILWLVSAGVGVLGEIPVSIMILIIGGMFIHLIASGVSKLLKLPSTNSSNTLSILITYLALTIPFGLPLIFMATASGSVNRFFPSFTILIAAHWLPFAYVYSMKTYISLACLLTAAGIVFGFLFTHSYAVCGFVTGSLLLLFSAGHYILIRKEINQQHLTK